MALSHNIADIRTNYCKQELTEESVAQNPIDQFNIWLEEAITAAVDEATAFVLSTVNEEGKPSARVLLLKEVNDHGFVFFTNYNSRKGHDLEQNPYACLTFFWSGLERQVRIEGKVQKVSPDVSDAYFHSRPKGSQIGAWASPQSQVISGREVLKQADAKYTEAFADQVLVPRPEHWGGYILEPTRIEFWQGRPNRLHDRILFELENGSWHTNRLAP